MLASTFKGALQSVLTLNYIHNRLYLALIIFFKKMSF